MSGFVVTGRLATKLRVSRRWKTGVTRTFPVFLATAGIDWKLLFSALALVELHGVTKLLTIAVEPVGHDVDLCGA